VGPGHTVTALYAVRTEPGARGHLATATVRWLDPETRDPHEETGDLEADALHGSLWSAAAACGPPPRPPTFADALGRGDRDLPDALRLDELVDHADDLADNTRKRGGPPARRGDRHREPHDVTPAH
ncbi:hypothetical protein ACFZAD_39410, partial [Streptomyces iakyrus]